MALAKVKRKGQVTIPAPIRERLALVEGDYLEVTVEDSRIVLTPKEVVDRHPAIDAVIEEGLADVAAGRVTPAFESMEEFETYRQTGAYRELLDKDD
jgi:AbrB family looped-hinge helix DNA binding protein